MLVETAAQPVWNGLMSVGTCRICADLDLNKVLLPVHCRENPQLSFSSVDPPLSCDYLGIQQNPLMSVLDLFQTGFATK